MGNNLNKIDSEMIKTHNASTAKSLKIFLFGINAGKSNWFNETFDHDKLQGITFKTESYSIGDKLPDIETIIYDTSENIGFIDEHLHYISNADGIILTYNVHDINSLNHLTKYIDKIIQNTFFSNKNTRCLLLGVKEVKESNNPLHFEFDNCTQTGQIFAAKWNLFHKQIDITKNIKTKEPYIYLLRRILKQKNSKKSSDNDDNVNIDDIDNDNDEEDTLLLIHDIMGDIIDQPGSPIHSSIHSSIDNDNLIDYDAECQCEFKRFLQVSLGKTRCDKYLPRFIDTQSNDIRFVDPDIFDDAFLSNDDIKMDILDKKLFQKEIEKYKQDTIKFEKKLNSIHLKEKYHKAFINVGIATLWSFFHHINNVNDIKNIINNKKDSMIIWKKLGKDNNKYNKKKQYKQNNNYKHKQNINLLNYNETKGGDDLFDDDIEQVEGDTDSDNGNKTDSDEMYNNNNNEIDGGLNVTTLLNNELNNELNNGLNNGTNNVTF